MPFSSTVDNVKHLQTAPLGIMAFDSAKELLKLADARLSQKSICGDSGKQPRPDSTDSTDSEETKT